MIIILNGSIGVGKTSVSWKLNEQLESSVMLDGDYLGAVNPFEIYDKKRTEYLYQTIAFLIKFHKENEYKNFIVNYVFETPDELDSLLKHLDFFDKKIYCFWLTCTENEQQKRIKKRNTDQVDWEITRAIQLNLILKKSSQAGFIGKKIATENKSLEIIGLEIIQIINSEIH